MARTKVATPPPPRVQALVASARQIKIDKSNGIATAISGEQWQELVWRSYNNVGEFRAACTWVGNVLSRARLYATVDDGSGPKPVPAGHIAQRTLDELFGGRDGQSGMLRDLGIFYSAPGQAYIVGYKSGSITRWGVYDSSQIQQSGKKFTLEGTELPANATIIRTWRPHPRDRSKADSPARAALPVLSEIERTTAHIAAQLTSRLASAGILLMPNEMTVTATVERTSEGETQAVLTAAELVERLSAVAARALADPSDPAALVPMVLTADGEHLDKPRLLTFWSELDKAIQEMRVAAVHRLALAMDMPPEVLTGLGDTNHWGAWQIDESAIKSHTEPLLNLIAYDLAVGYLRPALHGEEGIDDVTKYGVAADTSDMRLRPNRSKEAFELWDRGIINGAALAREAGFHEDDLMDDTERNVWLLMKMAAGSTTPEIVVEAARMLGVQLPPAALEAPATEERPSPSLLEHPVRDAPEEPAAALVAAAEQMVFRALERSGNRLANRPGCTKPHGVAAPEVYLFAKNLDETAITFALDDAWSQVDRFASRYGVTPDWLQRTLDEYTRSLMREGKQHDPALLATHLREANR